MFRLRWLVSALAVVMAASPLIAGSVVEAKKAGVKVYEKPSKKAKILLKLKKGDRLDSKDRKGMYWKVRTKDGTEGFVSVMKVKRKSVESDDQLASALRKAVQDKADDDSSNARARSAVMGVRGLDESKDIEFIGNVKPNLRSVFKMESLVVSSGELEKLEGEIFSEIEGKMKK